MTPETAAQQAIAALADAGLDGYVRDIQADATRDRFEQEGRVIWDEPAIRVRVTIGEHDDPGLPGKILDALWTLEPEPERGGYDGQSLISVFYGEPKLTGG